ncbi:MAG: NifB/NifX family molybdenum-iron cluster-binding protein [Trichlorobacter sp.]
MKICFPVAAEQGLESTVYDHFGSARQFVVVDSETGQLTAIDNRDLGHQHGACNPVGALGGHGVDVIVVGGIGAGAMAKLQQAGIQVFRAQAATVRENLDLFKSGAFNTNLAPSCGAHQHAHGHEHTCSH